VLDTLYLVETPENIELEAELAGPVARVLAYAIDLGIRSIALTAISIAMLTFGQTGWGLFLIFSFLLEWFYPVAFEVFRQGQTPGKKMMGLVVINDDLTPVTASNSVVRNLLRAADFFPFFYLGGLVSMVLNPRFQRMGDMAAGTLVVYQREIKQDVPLPNVLPCQPAVHLKREEEVAIVNFTQRHNTLSKPRQQELANVLEEFSGKAAGSRVKFLQGVGNWLMGDRQ